MWLRTAYMVVLFFCLSINGQAQKRLLPIFSVDRRMDEHYMDSLSRLAWQQYNQANTARPLTLRNDTLRLQALYYLGRLYNWWPNRRDSTLYFGRELTRKAHDRNNIEYQVKGILLNEFYYHYIRSDYPEALRLNYQAKTILRKARQDPKLGWRFELNLGELYVISGDYDNALTFLNRAKLLIVKGSGLNPQFTAAYQADIEQKIGFLYDRQSNHIESEKHYLEAEKLLANGGSKTNFGFVYEVLSSLYLTTGQYQKALIYAQKAEPLWESIDRPNSITNNWSILAIGYAATGQNELAFSYANKVLNHKQAIQAARRRAFLALQKAYENQKEWGKSLFYYKKYVALSDTARDAVQAEKVASLQRKNDLELVELQNQQAQQLQTERLKALQKQAELDRLRASTQADALTKKAQLTEQHRQLDNQKAQLILTRQQNHQKLQQQSFQQERLKQENKIQRNWLFYSGSSLLFLVGVLSLLLYAQRLRKRQIKAELQLTEQQNQANINILNAQETERRRLAQDLHDDIGTSLIALRGKLPPTNPDAHHLLDQIITDVRAVSHNLMPDELATLGLSGAVGEASRRLQESSGIRFLFVSAGEVVPLSQVAELALYRAVLELMHNVVRHSGATEAVVQLVYHADLLNVTVEDNGKGFTNHTVTSDGGIGLKNVASRTEWLGGKLAIDSLAAGTTIRLDIPYDTHAT